ncbi:MAG: MFS transporter [Chloroflexota bacterium]|nr:MFS transporter [Chloroflexota bacterium]
MLALLAALFAGGVATAPIRALLPAYVESVLQQPPVLTSTLLSVQLACGGLFSLAGGAVSDLVSRRAAVLVGLTTSVVGAALFAVQSPSLLVAIAVLWGIGFGFQSTGGQSFLISAVSRARIGSATAVYFVSGTASNALGASVAGIAADRFGFQTVAAGAALLGLMAFVLAARFLPPLGADNRPQDADSRPRDADSRPQEMDNRLQDADSRPQDADRRPRGSAPAASTRASRKRSPSAWTWRSYADLLRQPDVLALGALRYFPTVAWGAASLAIPLLVFRLSHTATAVGLYGMVSLLAASGAQLATGRQIDRLTRRHGAPSGAPGPSGPRRLVVPLTGGILICATGAMLFNGSLVGLFITGTGWAMSAWALSTTMPPLIHELGEGRDDGRLVAFTHLLWSAGMLSGTLAAGVLIDRHPAAPFALALVCLLITLAIGSRFSHSLDSRTTFQPIPP